MKVAVASMEMAPGVIPRPGKVPKQRLLSPELGFLVAAELWNSSGEIVDPLRIFTVEAIYSAKGVARRCTRRPRHPSTPPPSWPRLGMAWRLWASLGLVLLAHGVFWRNRIYVIFQDFSEHFHFLTFSAMHKQNKQELALWHLVNRLVQ